MNSQNKIINKINNIINKIPLPFIDKGRRHLTIGIKNESFKMEFNIQANPRFPTIGMLSRIPNDFHHVVFIDYDNIIRCYVEKELELLAEKYQLTPFYLFASREEENKGGLPEEQWIGNYHAISLTKVTFRKLYNIILDSHSEINWKSVPRYSIYKAWVLRVTGKAGTDIPKPKFIKVIPENSQKWNLEPEISRAFLIFLKNNYPEIPEIPYKHIDNSNQITLVSYVTAKK